MNKSKYIIKRFKTLSFLILFVLIFVSCYHYPDFENFGYDEYNRVMGPEGGEINFYRNYENDSIRDLAVKMIFPVNAVDSILVFNMYEFYDEVTYYDLDYVLSMEQFSDFLYFVPFYESEGYREVLNDSSDFNQLVEKHTSITFNDSVTVIYYNCFYEGNADNAELYRIKIPAEDEWGEANNVWVNYNMQGYPEGYDEIDLIYLIMGRWTEINEWGTDNFSLDNWELIPDYVYDPIEKTVTFKIINTDYMYVTGNLIF